MILYFDIYVFRARGTNNIGGHSRGGKNILFSVNPIKKLKIFCHIQETSIEGYEYTFAEIILFILILTLSLH